MKDKKKPIKYICPKCKTKNTYHPRKDPVPKRPRTTCPSCHNDVFVNINILPRNVKPLTSNITEDKKEGLLKKEKSKQRAILYKCPKCGNQRRYVQKPGRWQKKPRTTCKVCHRRIVVTKNVATPAKKKLTPHPKSAKKSAKIKSDIKQTGPAPLANTSENLPHSSPEKKLPVEPPTPNFDINPQSKGKCVYPEPLWRSHCYRFRIDLFFEPKSIIYDRVQKRAGGWLAKIKNFPQWKLEVHELVRHPNVVINISDEICSNHPRKADLIAEKFALKCRDYLIHQGFRLGVDIKYLQGNHHALPDMLDLNGDYKIAQDEFGRTVIIDHSPDKAGHPHTELEVIEKKEQGELKKAYQIADAPNQVTQLTKLVMDQQVIIAELNKQINELKGLIFSKKPKSQEKDESGTLYS
jgi:DNA-directed RNA polymerase subunit RPC12/RpoP